MFRTRYFRFLFIAAAAVAVACTDDPVDPADSADTDPVEDAEPASLTINFSIADLGVDVSTRGAGTGPVTGSVTGTGMGTRATRGVSGTLCDGVFGSAEMIDPDNLAKREDYDDTPEKKYRWSEAALVNGSRMTCLTVILIHRRSNKIVGIRRIPDPDCPNYDVRYRTTDQGDGLQYPPRPENKDEVEFVKKNCLFDDDEVFAPVLKDKEGHDALDDLGHIKGLFGKTARVTFDYEKPIHVVNQEMLDKLAKTKFPKNVEAQNKFKTDNSQYLGQSAERLLRGEYTVLAIANYDHRVTTASEEGVSGDKFPTMNVDKTLEDLTNLFHDPVNMANGIYPVAPVPGKPELKSYDYLYNLRFLMNRTLDDKYNVIDVGPFTDKDGKQVLPYIRPAVHQTLTAAKDVYLEAGNNVLNIELLRIASRTRVEVKNYAKEPLQVNSLKFSPNYTQSTTYLFRRYKASRDYSELASKKDDTPGNAGKYTDHDGKGAPMVDYTGIYNYFNGETYGAIVPFIKDWNSDGKDGMDGVRVEGVSTGKNKRCIFDALMYESHLDYKDMSHTPEDDDSFYYTIDVSYPTVTALDANGDGDTDDVGDIKGYKTTDINKIDTDRQYITYENTGFDYTIKDAEARYLTGFGNKEGLYTLMNKGYKGNYYLIQGVQTGKYLYERSDGKLCAMKLDEGATLLDLEAGNIDGVEIERFLWSVDIGMASSGFFGPKYPIVKSIKNKFSNKYTNAIPKNAAGMMADTGSHQYQLQVIGNNVAFSTSYSDGNTYYLNVYGGGNELGGWNGTDAGSQFRLYPVKSVSTYEGTPRMTKKVELTAFSDKTGYVEKVREIQRNDFIRILVEVSYNSIKGDFEFQVKPWDNREGNVEFH